MIIHAIPIYDTSIIVIVIKDLSIKYRERRFYFFKVTSADSHYEYFKKLFTIYQESDWQDREEVGEEILANLVIKRQELIIDLEENDIVDNDAAKV